MKLPEILKSKPHHRQFIRQLAHWVDKTFYLDDPKSGRQRSVLVKKLKSVLNDWKTAYPHDTLLDIEWADRLVDDLPDTYKRTVPAVSGIHLRQLLMNRTSCRRWEDRPLSTATVLDLLEVGLSAPSSANRQSVRFCPIYGEEEKLFLADLTDHSFLKMAPVIVLIGVDTALYGRHEYDRVVEDAAVCAQTISVYAEGLGLGSCMITAHELKDPEVSSRYSDMPKVQWFIVLAIGYPGEVSVKPPRQAVESHIERTL